MPRGHSLERGTSGHDYFHARYQNPVHRLEILWLGILRVMRLEAFLGEFIVVCLNRREESSCIACVSDESDRVYFLMKEITISYPVPVNR